MTAYSKGYHWEREAKRALENLGLPVIRSAGSHHPDLVVPKFIIEVKYRQKIPKTLAQATTIPISSPSGFIATSLLSIPFHSLFFPQPVPSIPFERLVPHSGLLLVRSKALPWIVIAKSDILQAFQQEVIQCAKLRKIA